MDFLIFFAALLPVAILLFYIYCKDSNSPEPVKFLIKGFFYGVFSCFVALVFSQAFLEIGLYTLVPLNVFESISAAFWQAAIPEESAKLLMLWLLLRKNNYFDENMDGIVYAVFVSLGFAAFENLLYLGQNYDAWLEIGVSRALFAVPGHFVFGILMGYYYSLAKFSSHALLKNRILVLAAPILMHGCYDSILFVMDVALEYYAVLTFVFCFFCYRMWKYGSKRIHKHLQNDGVEFTD